MWFVFRCFSLTEKKKEKKKENLLLFSVNTKKFSSHELKISKISLVLRTRECTDIFITVDDIYLVFTSEIVVNIL